MESLEFVDPTAAFDTEQDLLQRQLALARALRNQPQRHYKTSAQATTGGIADILRNVASRGQEWRAQAGMQDLAQRRASTASPQAQLEMALKQEQLGRTRREEADATAPVTQLDMDVAKKFGFNLPQGMTRAQAKPLLEFMERAYSADQRAKELRLNRDAMAGARSDAAALKAEEKADKETKELSEDLGKMGAPTFFQGYNEAKGIIEKNQKDLPGFGPVAGLLPDFMVSGEGKDLRQSVGQMLSEYRKGQTGSGMSDAERTEYGQITGLLKSGDEEAVKKGVERLMRARAAQVSNRAAGSPEAAQRLAERQPYLKQALGAGAGGADPAKDIRARIAQMKGRGMTNEQIKARLTAEGYASAK